jgi:hypothetical protein
MEEHRSMVSESTVLRGIFGRKKEKVAGGWRMLHSTLHQTLRRTDGGMGRDLISPMGEMRCAQF